ncbi:unnamed protein product [Moneuplotes crassus]|uniref:Uncharacterized protein n=1 Tax=Euplotes crassus TaxID=5936 RepID=A0AAD1U215_EUPCR|nr:unnamed protein product [Moneuplotes crassus]
MKEEKKYHEEHKKDAIVYGYSYDMPPVKKAELHQSVSLSIHEIKIFCGNKRPKPPKIKKQEMHVHDYRQGHRCKTPSIDTVNTARSFLTKRSDDLYLDEDEANFDINSFEGKIPSFKTLKVIGNAGKGNFS